MKVHALWLTAIVIGIAGCGEREQPGAQIPEGSGPAEPAAEVASPSAQVDEAFIDHMHAHAERLDELMFALADDDLDGALTPAYWLSRHDVVAGIPEDWQQYVTGMRAAAREVGAARDLETARIAAEKISAFCQACHEAAGVNAIGGP